MSAVVVSPYSPEWPQLFHVLRERLLPVFASQAIVIEHIGSTAVPGLAAKPVIDMLLGAAALADVESKIGALDGLGFTYIPKYERELPMRRYFVSASAIPLRVHLHAIELDSPLWQQHLMFRDALRADAGLRARYQSLKLGLANTFAGDKAAYTAAKSPFIQSMLAGLAERSDEHRASIASAGPGLTM